MNLGLALREVRMKKFPNREKKQYQIAELAGISQTYLAQIENGNKKPHVDVIEKLCKVYDITPSILFWMAMEPKDIKKNKLKAYNSLKGPINELISEFLLTAK